MSDITAFDVVKFIEESLGQGPYTEWDGGFYAGTPQDPIKSVAVTWMILTPILKKIAAANFDMIVCHEGPWIGPTDDYKGPWDENVSKNPAADLERKRILREKNITFFGCHHGLDKLIIYDEFARSIGCGKSIAGTGYTQVFEMKPITVKDLIKSLKKKFNLDFIRYVGNESTSVRQPGLLFGGVGLNMNSKFKIPYLLNNGADVIVAGEMDEFTIYNCAEAGIPIIECGHAVSELPGLIKFTEMLKQRFPQLRINFFLTPNYNKHM